MLTLLLMQRLVLVVACVATKNSSAMLFVAAKYPSTLCYLKVESKRRVLKWLVKWMQKVLVTVQIQGLVK
jgi:hypothetical protein